MRRVQQAQRGLSQASDRSERFVTHLEPLRGALEGFCRRALTNVSDVEDVLQASVLRSFRDFHLYAEGTNFRAWIFRYVRFEVLNCNRRHGKRAASLSAAELVEEQAVGGVLEQAEYEHLLQAPEIVLEHCEEDLAAALRDLPDAEREVLLLRAIGEFSYRDIADVLEIPVGTVMGSLHRARMNLRRRLAVLGRNRGWLSD